MSQRKRTQVTTRRLRAPVRVAALAFALIAAALLVPPAAEARMYQWVNPKTGLSQLSGTPPPWYRSARGGPRVLVFDQGVLIDDTELPVTQARAESLRQAAFFQVARRKELAALERLEEAARREVVKAERARRPPRERRRLEEEGQTAQESSSLGSLEQFGADTIERLKSIIAEFDRIDGGQGQTAKP